MASGFVPRAGLEVAAVLAAFIEDEVLAGTGVAADAFWSGLAALDAEMAPRRTKEEVFAWRR